MNRCFLSLRAASCTRSSALSARVRHCVRGAFCFAVFPLAGLLPSTPSSTVGQPASFGGFIGTTSPCDFCEPCIVGVWPAGLPDVSRRTIAAGGSQISRFSCREVPCVLGVSDRAGPTSHLAIAMRGVLPSA